MFSHWYKKYQGNLIGEARIMVQVGTRAETVTLPEYFDRLILVLKESQCQIFQPSVFKHAS